MFVLVSHKERTAQKTACGWLCWIGNDWLWVVTVFPPHADTQTHTHYIAPVHTSSWLNIIPPNPHTTCLRPPCWRNWPSSELPPPAACGHVSCSITRQPRRHNNHSAPREHLLLASSAGERAASRWHGHMFVPFVSPAPERFSITSSVVWLRISVTLPVVCVSVFVIHGILTLYQHNWGNCQVGPWITFHWCVWPDWSTTSRAFWPKRVTYSGETLRLSGCHVTSGIDRAQKKGRASQIQHVSYTQAVLTPARPRILVCLYACKCYKNNSSRQLTASWRQAGLSKKFHFGFNNNLDGFN